MIKTFFLVGYICSYGVANYIDPYCLPMSEQFDTLEECRQLATDLDNQAKIMRESVLTKSYFQCLEAPIQDKI